MNNTKELYLRTNIYYGKNNLFEIAFFQEYLHGFFKKKIETSNKTGYHKMNVILRFSFSICSRRRAIF